MTYGAAVAVLFGVVVLTAFIYALTRAHPEMMEEPESDPGQDFELEVAQEAAKQKGEDVFIP